MVQFRFISDLHVVRPASDPKLAPFLREDAAPLMFVWLSIVQPGYLVCSVTNQSIQAFSSAFSLACSPAQEMAVLGLPSLGLSLQQFARNWLPWNKQTSWTWEDKFPWLLTLHFSSSSSNVTVTLVQHFSSWQDTFFFPFSPCNLFVSVGRLSWPSH